MPFHVTLTHASWPVVRQVRRAEATVAAGSSSRSLSLRKMLIRTGHVQAHEIARAHAETPGAAAR